MASLNNKLRPPLSLGNIENGLNKHHITSTTKIKPNMKWKKILTWCLIAIIFNMLLIMTISVITETKLKKILGSQLDENHNAIQKFYKKFLEFNSSLTMMRSVINRISYFSISIK